MCRVLILDDNPDFAEMIKRILEDAGEAESKIATNFEDAQNKVIKAVKHGKPFEVFLINQRLGLGKDGFEAMQELRAISPDTDAIVFTDVEDPENGVRAYEAGAFRYLSKPFENRELLFLLKSLKLWREEQQELSWQKIFNGMMEESLRHESFLDVGKVVVEYALKLGFSRAHLFWVPTREDSNIHNQMVGIANAGEGCIPEFPRSSLGTSLYPLNQWFNLDKTEQSRNIIFLRPDQAEEIQEQAREYGYQWPAGEVIFLPLWGNTGLLGALLLDHGQQQTSLSEHEHFLLNFFARQVAIVLENAGSIIRERRSVQELATISHIGRDVIAKAVEETNLSQLIEEVREQMAFLMDVSNFAFFLVNPESNKLDMRLLYEKNVRCKDPSSVSDMVIESFLLTRYGNSIFWPVDVQGYLQKYKINLEGEPPSSCMGVQLHVGENIIGGITIKRYESEEQFTKRDHILLSSVANQISGAIQLIHVYEIEKLDTKRLNVLRRAMTEMLRIAQENEDNLWLTTLTIATANFGTGFDRAFLFLENEDSTRLTGIASMSKNKPRKKSYQFDDYLKDLITGKLKLTSFDKTIKDVALQMNGEDNIFAQVLRERHPKIIEADEVEYLIPTEISEKISLAKCAVLPILAGNREIGIIIIDNKHTGALLSDKLLNRLQTFLSYVGVVWETLRQHHKSETLLEANYTIMGNAGRQTLDATLHSICKTARIVTEADWVIIYPLKPSASAYEFEIENISYDGRLKHPITEIIKERPRQKGVSAHILRSGVLAIPDVTKDSVKIGKTKLSDHHFIQREGVQALIGVPIRDVHTAESLGVLYLDYRTPRSFSESDIRNAFSFSSLAAIAISNSRQFEKERQSAFQSRQREREISHRMLEEALASDTDAKVIKALLSNIHEALSLPKENLTLILEEWQSASLNDEPRAVFISHKLNVNGELIKKVDALYKITIRTVIHQKKTRRLSKQRGVYVPIKLADSVIGMFWAEAQSESLTADQIDILERLAPVAALALDNIHQQEHLHSVLRVAQAVTKPTNLQATLKTVAETVRQVSPDLSALTLWHKNSESGTLQLVESFGLHLGKKVRRIRMENEPGHRNIVQTVMDSPRPIWAEQIAEHPNLIGRFVKDEKIVSVAAFPLQVDNEVVGAMFFNYRNHHFFSTEEETIFTILAEIVAASIRDVTRLELEKKQQERLSAALEAAEALGTVLDLEELFKHILTKLHGFFEETTLCVLTFDEDNHALVFAPATLEFYSVDNPVFADQRSFPLESQSIACRVARRTIVTRKVEMENVTDVNSDPDYLALNIGTQSELCITLVGNDQKLLGVLALERAGERGFNDDDVLLVQSIARHISIAIERARQSEQLEFKSTVAAAYAWAADIAHDINREVGQIRSWAYLAKEEAYDAEKVLEYADKIEKSASILSSAGPWSTPIETILPLDSTLQEYIKLYARQRNIAVEFDLNCNKVEVKLNPIALQRVIKQLVRNAAQAMESATKEKKILVSSHLLEGNKAEIQFQDFGPGVDENIRLSLFQRSVTTKGDVGGYGLLNTRQMVEEMGGQIRLLPSEQGRGALFSIRLPTVS